jgi:sugar phosphate isomerase/epimerase
MQYGAMNFPVKPVLNELEEIAARGFDYLELTMDPPKAHHKDVQQQKKEIIGALNSHKMDLICHLPAFVSTADLTDGIRAASLKEILMSLEVAAELDSLKVVLHPGHIGGMGFFVKEQAKKYAMESLDAVAEKVEQLGMNICLENMFPKYPSFVYPEDFVEIFKRFPSFKLVLDIGHAHIGSKRGDRVFRFIEKFHSRIGHIHVSDNFGKEDQHLPIGVGAIDFPKVVKALKKIGYEDTVTFEIFSRDRDYLEISRWKFSVMLAQG